MLDVAGGTVDHAYIERWVAVLGLTEIWQRLRAD
jgi:hypothetical protein